MSDYFIPENVDLHDYKANPHVIVNKKYLSFYPNYNPEDHERIVPYAPNWYPMVNSYYEYAEDYDAVNRVPHVMQEHIEHFQGNEDETYNWDNPKTELDQFMGSRACFRYLIRKPKSFLILGKPGIGETQLGKLLADYWNCVYITPETLIQDELQSQSRVGLCIEFNLRCGRAISVDVILRLLEKRLRSQSVEHRGFVICGFPLLANDLYVEDPVSSESAIFNVHEIFDEVFDSATQENIKNVSRADSEEQDNMPHNDDDPVIALPPLPSGVTPTLTIKDVSITPRDVGPDDAHVVFQSNALEDEITQMDYIFNLCEKHDYLIIYIKCSNAEVINIRKNNRVDAETLEYFNAQRERSDKVLYKLYPYFGGMEQVAEEIFTNRKLLKLQRDFCAQVRTQLQKYVVHSQMVIEKYILMHNPENVIKVDGRMSGNRMFQVIKTRLKVLPITPNLAVVPFGTLAKFVEPGEDSPREVVNLDMLTPDRWFQDLNHKQVPSYLYKWNLSDWEYLCPVELYHGRATNGYYRFGVHFFDKIYFLSSEMAQQTFIRNPRPYLLSPQSKGPMKIFVSGPELSGRTDASKVISIFMGFSYIDAEQVVIEYLENQKQFMIEKVKEAAIQDALDYLKERRRQKYWEEENERQRRVEAFIDFFRELLHEYIECANILGTFNEIEFTSLPVPSRKDKPPEILKCEEDIQRLEKAMLDTGVTKINDNICRAFLADEHKILDYLPVHLQAPNVFEFDLISVNHPYVQLQIQDAISRVEDSFDIRNPASNRFGECLKDIVYSVENMPDYMGCVIDGLPAKREILESLGNELDGSKIFTIKDSTNGSFLEHLHTEHYIEQDADFPTLFRHSGHIDKAIECEDKDRIPQTTYRKDGTTMINNVYNMNNEQFHDYISTYGRDYDEFMHYLVDKNVKVVEFDAANKTKEELLLEIIEELENTKMSPKAIVYTKELREEDRKTHRQTHRVEEDEELGENEVEDEEKNRDEWVKLIEDNKKMGDTSEYCPVAYFTHNVLWKAKDDITAKFREQLFNFSSKKALDTFMNNPTRYAFSKGLPEKFPPLRICVVGVKHIGKTTVSQRLARMLGIFYGNFDDIYNDFVENYMASEDDLEAREPAEHEAIEGILYPFWFKEPRRSMGFILDGFPRHASDVRVMCDNFFIPDIVIELYCPESMLNDRILQILLNEWQIQIEQTKARDIENYEHELEAWRRERERRKTEYLRERRDIRYALRTQVGAEDEDYQPKPKSLISFKSIEEASDLQEIERILEEDLPEPILGQHWETYDMAVERIRNGIEETATKDPQMYAELFARCQEENFAWQRIDASLDILRVYNQAIRAVLPYRNKSSAIFERVYDVSVDIAEKLLNNGYYFLSRFGRTCPVQMYEKYNYLQVFLPKEPLLQIFPCIYRKHIYYLNGADNRTKFKAHATKYVTQKYDRLPMFRFRLAIIGPPKCGKSTIAERVQLELGLMHISIGKAARYVLKNLSGTLLAKKVQRIIAAGGELTDSLAMKCVEAMSFEGKAVALGVVFDGFPNNLNEVRHLARFNLVPHLIIDLQASLSYIHTYMDVFATNRRPEFSKKFIAFRHKVWATGALQFREWTDREYQNIAKVAVDPGKWANWTGVKELLLSVVSEVKFYYTNKGKDMPLRIGNMLVTPYEFLSRQLKTFKNYCPLCLYHSNMLTFGGHPPDRSGLVQYLHDYYWLCPKHIEAFILNPNEYLKLNVRHTLPINLPRRITIMEKPDNCYGDGLCVPCWHKTHDGQTFSQGSIRYAIEYCDKIYLFDTEECMNMFLQAPNRFSTAVINPIKKVKYPSLQLKDLPTLGLLEQFDATQIVKAVISVNNIRPGIPGLDIQTSAIIALALCLKINNPNCSKKYIDFYKRAQNLYEERKLLFLEAMAELRKTINPFLKYDEPLPPFQWDETKRRTVRIKESATSINANYMRTFIDELLDKIDY